MTRFARGVIEGLAAVTAGHDGIELGERQPAAGSISLRMKDATRRGAPPPLTGATLYPDLSLGSGQRQFILRRFEQAGGLKLLTRHQAGDT